MELSYEKYHLDLDSCTTIQFLDKDKVVYRKECKEYDKDKSVFSKKLDGEILELYCNELVYEIDSVDIIGGKYISAYDRNMNKCFGFHILDNNSFRIVTRLKQGGDINFHFTEPKLYINSNLGNKFHSNESITIRMLNEPQEGMFYIAYNQVDYENSVVNDNHKTVINLKEGTNCFRTDLEINPSFYALKQYKIEITNSKTDSWTEVPIVYHNEYSTYRNMTSLEKVDFHEERKIIDKFIVVYRFNPGRTRVVNKLYKEDIIGQVQPFELVLITEK